MGITITLTPNVWTEITSADSTVFTASNTSGLPIFLMATDGPAPIADGRDGVLLLRGDRLVNQKLATFSPGQNVPRRLWAWASGAADIWIDHKQEIA